MGKYIKVFNSKDEDAFRAFKNVGHLSHDHLKSLGLSETKIKNYCREGYAKKVSYNIKGQKENGVCYKLTNLGKEVGADKFGLKNYMQTTDQHERHNLDVANKYMSLTKEERLTVMNEREVRELVQQRIYEIENKMERDHYQELLDQGKMSMPDVIYVTEEGVTVAYET
ncbi:hypothetical protein KWK86_019520, partial [Clostridioides difficile]|nr:hypothetical protein [Clostridioides difficile]